MQDEKKDTRYTIDNIEFDDNSLETLSAEDIKKEVTQEEGVLLIRPLNKVIEEAKKKPVPKKIIGDLWVEGQITIAFSGPGNGKSILSYQTMDAISKGTGHVITGSPFVCEVGPAIGLYIDFELSEKQVEKRYSEEVIYDGEKKYINHYQFHPNFLRCEKNANYVGDHTLDNGESYLRLIEDAVLQTGAKYVVIDNVSCIINEIEKSKYVKPFLDGLKLLKIKHELSLLVIAHTPKIDPFKPLHLNDIAGSKAFANFTDNAFGIGEDANDKTIKYIKATKNRDSADGNTVSVVQIVKESNFLGFKYLHEGYEKQHLKEAPDPNAEIKERIKNLHESGLNYEKIAEELGYKNKGTISKIMRK